MQLIAPPDRQGASGKQVAVPLAPLVVLAVVVLADEQHGLVEPGGPVAAVEAEVPAGEAVVVPPSHEGPPAREPLVTQLLDFLRGRVLSHLSVLATVLHEAGLGIRIFPGRVELTVDGALAALEVEVEEAMGHLPIPRPRKLAEVSRGAMTLGLRHPTLNLPRGHWPLAVQRLAAHVRELGAVWHCRRRVALRPLEGRPPLQQLEAPLKQLDAAVFTLWLRLGAAGLCAAAAARQVNGGGASHKRGSDQNEDTAD
mmetsp:Transcript_65836/g.148572  ORF Transcript_65836/g.148572 Transcript_65836/m.148572 type:complete len:255 (+) Transcript_65836:78-842(+)